MGFLIWRSTTWFWRFWICEGGDITSDAVISLTAANVSTGELPEAFIFNDGDGHIGGDALINGEISNELTAQKRRVLRH